MNFVTVKHDGSDLGVLCSGVRGSGHPSFHPKGYILTDTYLKAWDFPQRGDGTVPLRWIHCESRKEYHPVRVDVLPRSEDTVLRLDPHPSWDRSYSYLTFNGNYEGKRCVFFADMRQLIAGDLKIKAVRSGPTPTTTLRKKLMSALRTFAGVARVRR